MPTVLSVTMAVGARRGHEILVEAAGEPASASALRDGDAVDVNETRIAFLEPAEVRAVVGCAFIERNQHRQPVVREHGSIGIADHCSQLGLGSGPKLRLALLVDGKERRNIVIHLRLRLFLPGAWVSWTDRCAGGRD